MATENCFSSTLAKAVCFGVPGVAWQNVFDGPMLRKESPLKSSAVSARAAGFGAGALAARKIKASAVKAADRRADADVFDMGPPEVGMPFGTWNLTATPDFGGIGGAARGGAEGVTVREAG